MRLKNKTALITGGNSSIGLATARLFISEGAQVAITGCNQKTLDAGETELGSRPLAIQADVTDLRGGTGGFRKSHFTGGSASSYGRNGRYPKRGVVPGIR